MASGSGTDKIGQKKETNQLENRRKQDERRRRSIFELPATFFDSCRLLQSPFVSPVSVEKLSISDPIDLVEAEESNNYEIEGLKGHNSNNFSAGNGTTMNRWSCGTCKGEFESLQDQRSHFKSDIHRLNIKLCLAGKGTIKEEDFDETNSNSLFENYEISSISGSEEEDDRESVSHSEFRSRLHGARNKLFVELQAGERVSVWKCLLLDESEYITFDNDRSIAVDAFSSYSTDEEVMGKLKYVVHEPRDSTCLRVVLLASGGHFAGCVFDGNSVVTHKTFHRYVVRAKAGKKQSAKDGGGRSIHSAGASLRRYNELALKKDIHELLAAWKSYFAMSSCIFLHAPSNNRQLFFDGEKSCFFHQPHAIRNIPLTVRRPTFKEARRIYNLLTEVSDEINEEITPFTSTNIKEEPSSTRLENSVQAESSKSDKGMNLEAQEIRKIGTCGSEHVSSENESESKHICSSTPLHEAAKSGNPQKVLELLEEGFDPCIKDERGQTPYMLAMEKEVRNTFRRFMASNIDKWDWHAAKVPSVLTKEMEEAQAAKQAERDAKKKARAKEMKKLRRAREKKAQADAAQANNTPSISKEEELKRAQDAEREKRAAAAERRIAAMAAAVKAQGTRSETTSSQSLVMDASDVPCSCCHLSLAGKVPFHRYNYKYCSTTCMHLHKEILEDG